MHMQRQAHMRGTLRRTCWRARCRTRRRTRWRTYRADTHMHLQAFARARVYMRGTHSVHLRLCTQAYTHTPTHARAYTRAKSQAYTLEQKRACTRVPSQEHKRGHAQAHTQHHTKAHTHAPSRAPGRGAVTTSAAKGKYDRVREPVWETGSSSVVMPLASTRTHTRTQREKCKTQTPLTRCAAGPGAPTAR